MTKTSIDKAAQKRLAELQAAIVDGLEDVKAQNIQVFDTEKLSPLFERVIVASATSARQTKALAASVRDKIREAGFDKPRTEGEDNGEWIIVDCGMAVVHIMQPAIRAYYRLEEMWGETPVAPKAPAKKATKTATKTAAKTAAKTATKTAAKKTAAKKTTTKKAAADATDAGAADAPVAKKTAAKKTAAKNTTAKKTAAKAPAAKKTTAKKTAAKKTAAKKAAGE